MGERKSMKRAAKAKAEVDSPTMCSLCRCRSVPCNYCQQRNNHFNSTLPTEIIILVPFIKIVNAHCFASIKLLIHSKNNGITWWCAAFLSSANHHFVHICSILWWMTNISISDSPSLFSHTIMAIPAARTLPCQLNPFKFYHTGPSSGHDGHSVTKIPW